MNPFRVVLVEDNPADMFLLKRALAEASIPCTLTELGDGEEAIHFLAQKVAGGEPPDLILLDLNTPKRGGSDVLETIQRLKMDRSIKVVVFTSSQSPKDRSMVEEMGALYLMKPADLDEYMKVGEVVRQLLGAPNGQ